MKERAIVFGSHRGLIGIVTEPSTVPTPARRGVVMSNIGVHHRVGPFRLYVDLARALASQGFVVLRFDLAGHGDSESRAGALDMSGTMRLDVSEAMQWLSDNMGVESFVLVGLCSGVDSTHAVATADPRVRGAVFVDGYTYHTPGFYLRRYSIRYLQLMRWVRYARRQGRRLLQRVRGERDEPSAPQVYSRAYPTLQQFRADVARMAERRTKLLFIYSGATFSTGYNARRQLFEQVGRAIPHEGISADFVPDADHLFTSLAHRKGLIERIVTWAGALGAQPAPEGAAGARTRGSDPSHASRAASR